MCTDKTKCHVSKSCSRSYFHFILFLFCLFRLLAKEVHRQHRHQHGQEIGTSQQAIDDWSKRTGSTQQQRPRPACGVVSRLVVVAVISVVGCRDWAVAEVPRVAESDADVGVGGEAIDAGGEIVGSDVVQLLAHHVAREGEVLAVAAVPDEALQFASEIERLNDAIVLYDVPLIKGIVIAFLVVGPGNVGEDSLRGVRQSLEVVLTRPPSLRVQALEAI
eukprot:GHVL01029588.1.p1 GENE.GHVL01029588.1~~GHVL01029588.1.p1  ORF type:complete len:219 (+),score=23.34 GHVL01029588.1:576-1232(+)